MNKTKLQKYREADCDAKEAWAEFREECRNAQINSNAHPEFALNLASLEKRAKLLSAIAENLGAECERE